MVKKVIYFFHSLFLGKVNKEIMFRDVLNRKQAFLENKNINPKNVIFCKGVNPRFLSKNSNFFLNLFYGKVNLEVMLYDVLDYF